MTDYQKHFFMGDNTSTPKFDGRILILPCVTVGNVGQLAVDLIISTLLRSNEIEHVGKIVTDALRPVVGPNPYEMSGTLMTAVDVYDSSSQNVTVVQIRSPCFREKRSEYLDDLTVWIKTNNFKNVIVLSSAYSQFLPDTTEDEGSNPVRYLQTSVSTLQVPLQPVYRVERYTHKPTNDPSGIIYLPGSGLTRKLFESLCKESIGVTVLVKYCSEGDNTDDAFQLLEKLNLVVPIKEASKRVTSRVSWDVPISWSGLYGDKAPITMF